MKTKKLKPLTEKIIKEIETGKKPTKIKFIRPNENFWVNTVGKNVYVRQDSVTILKVSGFNYFNEREKLAHIVAALLNELQKTGASLPSTKKLEL